MFFCFTEGRIVALHGIIKKTQKTPQADLDLARNESVNLNRRKPWRRKKPRSTEGFTTLDEFLDEQGTREAFQAVAIKEVLAWQIRKAMETEHLSQKSWPKKWAPAAARSAACSTR